jgi:hypothetical protein
MRPQPEKIHHGSASLRRPHAAELASRVVHAVDWQLFDEIVLIFGRMGRTRFESMNAATCCESSSKDCRDR